MEPAFGTTVTFEAAGNRTQMTMRALFPTAADLAAVIEKYAADEGGKQTIERLAVHLAAITGST